MIQMLSNLGDFDKKPAPLAEAPEPLLVFPPRIPEILLILNGWQGTQSIEVAMADAAAFKALMSDPKVEEGTDD